jgi:hypothetical protein
MCFPVSFNLSTTVDWSIWLVFLGTVEARSRCRVSEEKLRALIGPYTSHNSYDATPSEGPLKMSPKELSHQNRHRSLPGPLCGPSTTTTTTHNGLRSVQSGPQGAPTEVSDACDGFLAGADRTAATGRPASCRKSIARFAKSVVFAIAAAASRRRIFCRGRRRGCVSSLFSSCLSPVHR